MATIYPRKNKDGSTSWRVMFRRKGFSTYCTVFSTEKEARDYAKENEKKFCGLDKQTQLNNRRIREFNENV